MEDSTCSSSTKALEEVSRRLHAGFFTNQFDAMCLASVELDDRGSGAGQKVSFSTPLSSVKPLRGLQGLCSEVLGILNSAAIAEQGTLGYLQQQISLAESFIAEQEQEQHQQGPEIISRNGEMSTADEKKKDQEWNSLPPAGDETRPSARPCQLLVPPSSQVLQARRGTHRRLQQLYDEVFELLAAKTRALELLDLLLAAYVQSVAGLAAASGLKHTTERAQYVSQPFLLDLLAHRFLDTAQVQCSAARGTHTHTPSIH